MTEMNKNSIELYFAEERQQRIIELLNKYSKLTVVDLSDYFNVSKSTVRNDLKELESMGLLKRTYGGAIKNTKTAFEQSSKQKEVRNRKEKEAIAALAVDCIEDGDVIALDSGTTCMEIARRMINKKGLTVISNDIKIAAFLEENSDATILVVGGILRKGFHCTIGYPAIDFLSTYNADKVFLGVNGLSVSKGITTPDPNHAEVKRKMLEIANMKIVVCDSSKINNIGLVSISRLNKIDKIITDSNIMQDDKKAIEECGVEVTVAEVGDKNGTDNKEGGLK